jgi:hypothetical protein
LKVRASKRRGRRQQRHQSQDIRVTFDDLRGLWPVAEFDVRRDQLAFLTGESVPGAMPPEYVHDFVFVAPGTEIRRLLAPLRRSRCRAQAE